MDHSTLTARIRIRIVLADAAALGPGKADLLAAIETCGSIAAAGRSMSMSYQRAWSLIDELNRMFCEPVVAVSRGGAARGGATLTEVGRIVLSRYRAIEAMAAQHCAQEISALASLVREDQPDIFDHR